MLLQLPAQRLPVYHWETVLHRYSISLVVRSRVLSRNMGYTHQTRRGSLPSYQMGSHLLLQGFDNRLRGVILQEEVEIGFVIVNQAAKGRNVHLS